VIKAGPRLPAPNSVLAADPPCLPPFAPPDKPKLLLTIDRTAPIGAVDTEGKGSAEVAFPRITAEDIGGGAPKIVCKAQFIDRRQVTYEEGLKVAFPVATTPVACVAIDTTGNVSPSELFTVTVCKAGTLFENGACAGGATRSWARGGGGRRCIGWDAGHCCSPLPHRLSHNPLLHP
jgi:hypothetical protein